MMLNIAMKILCAIISMLLLLFLPFFLLIEGAEKLELEQHLPGSVRRSLTLETEEKSVFRDALYLYVYSVDEAALDDVYNTLLNQKGWQELPMTEREYAVYVERCCSWPANYLPDDFFDGLEAEGRSGLWKYSGDFSGKKFPETGRVSVTGSHKFFLFLPDDAKLIYIDVDY